MSNLADEVFGEGALPHRVTVYVPSTRDGNIPLDSATAEANVSWVVAQLTRLFGGCTATLASGAFLLADGTVVTEQVTIVYASVGALSIEVLRDVREIADVLKAVLNQETVAVEIDGDLRFV